MNEHFIVEHCPSVHGLPTSVKLSCPSVSEQNQRSQRDDSRIQKRTKQSE